MAKKIEGLGFKWITGIGRLSGHSYPLPYQEMATKEKIHLGKESEGEDGPPAPDKAEDSSPSSSVNHLVAWQKAIEDTKDPGIRKLIQKSLDRALKEASAEVFQEFLSRMS